VTVIFGLYCQFTYSWFFIYFYIFIIFVYIVNLPT
jgi:hypothetical protein